MREFRRSAALLVAAALLVVAAANSLPLKNIDPQIKSNDILRDDDVQYRLGVEVVPSHYKIIITPVFENDNAIGFTGEVVISARVQEAINKITLHKASNIKINKEDVKVSLKESEALTDLVLKDPTENVKAEFYEIHLSDEVPVDSEIEITISYTADFPDGLYGFYKSTYSVTLEGEKKQGVLLTTQFQPTHARKAFPCFDEPRFKTTFDLTLVVPSNHKTLSNTPGATKDSGETVFETTPKMSTYLLAFIVYKEDTFGSTNRTTGNVPFQTWGRKDQIDAGAGELSQTDGPQIISFMEEYTGIRYTDNAEKIDQAAIPDFSFGAMENWGLVTYRETALLYHKSEHTQAAKKQVSELIAHELAHQWFGNLVTTEWWSTAWLNEGFATYFEYYITDKVHPKWRMMERLVVDEQLKALSSDATSTSPALTFDVNSPEEVINHFGTITYSKGGSIVRMFANILGESNFKKALQNYLSDNAGDVGTPEKLFNALKKQGSNVASSVDLNAVFESWTTSSGFPVISVAREESRIVFTQEQFLEDGTSTGNKYNIFLNVVSNDEEYDKKNVWYLERNDQVTLNQVPDTDSWLLVPTTGYFRVNYDEENWALLTEQLRNDTLSEEEELIEPLERAILIDNALTLARANKLKYSTAIQLLSYLENELDFIPWSVAFSGLNYLYRMLNAEGDTLERFILQITSNVYDDLGFKVVEANNDDTHIEHVHRANVLNWACRAGHPECIESAVEHLQNYLKEGSETVSPDLRSVVYCYGVKHDDKLWPKLWKKLAETDDATERSLLISALGCSKISSTLYAYMDSAVLGEAVQIQDITRVFSAVYSNAEGVDVALGFLEFNIQKIQERMLTTMNGLSNIIRGIGQIIFTKEQKQRLESIAKKLTGTAYENVAATALASAEVNLAWLEQHKNNVLEELEKILESVVLPPSTTPSGAWGLRPTALALVATVTLPVVAFLL